jgi:hypothetical protein
MLQKKDLLLSHFQSCQIDRLPGVTDSFHASGGGAGGYLENVLAYAAKELFQTEIGPVEYKIIR